MATRRLTIPTGDIAVHEVPLTAGDVLVVAWVDRINAFELINHGANPAWFTTDNREPTIRGGQCRVALPWSSTVVNQLRPSAWRAALIAEEDTTVTLISS